MENGAIAQHKSKGRRYSAEEKAAAVRMVRTLRVELGTSQGTTSRVAEQLGYGVEPVRAWVRQADTDDGVKAGSLPTSRRVCVSLNKRTVNSSARMRS